MFAFTLFCTSQAFGSVYFNDFDGGESHFPGVSGGFSGTGIVESVQGYSAYSFADNFLRVGLLDSARLQLSNLPTHDSIDLNFLLAIIDSWDGNGAPRVPTAST